MHPSEFLALAHELLLKNQAAHNRAAIGRGYYAVFHAALSCQRIWGFAPLKNARDHSRVRDLFTASGDPNLAILASQLEDLHNARKKADYRLNSPIDSKAGAWVKVASQIMTDIDMQVQKAPDPNMIKLMEDWVVAHK